MGLWRANPMEINKQKGQAMVEFSLVLTLVLLILLGLIDPFFYGVNIAIAKIHSYQAAREASIFIADGTHSCSYMAQRVVGTPILLMVDTNDPANWDLTVDPCLDDTSWSPSSAVPVKATFKWNNQKTIWWSGPWSGEMFTSNVFQ